MPWKYITKLMGDGSLWSRTQEQMLGYIAQAEADGQHGAAEHLRSMLELRNKVFMDKPIEP